MRAHPSFGMTSTKTLRSVFSWRAPYISPPQTSLCGSSPSCSVLIESVAVFQWCSFMRTWISRGGVGVGASSSPSPPGAPPFFPLSALSSFLPFGLLSRPKTDAVRSYKIYKYCCDLVCYTLSRVFQETSSNSIEWALDPKTWRPHLFGTQAHNILFIAPLTQHDFWVKMSVISYLYLLLCRLSSLQSLVSSCLSCPVEKMIGKINSNLIESDSHVIVSEWGLFH